MSPSRLAGDRSYDAWILNSITRSYYLIVSCAGGRTTLSCERKPMVEQRKVVTAMPENSETPLEGVRSWITPTRLFFVRNHFTVPTVDITAWRLNIEGRVKERRAWTWDELMDLPERTVFATVECAGNGR